MTKAAEIPLLGSEEQMWAVPMDFSGLIGAPGSIVLVESAEGFIPIQPRCWWEPIEDEE